MLVPVPRKPGGMHRQNRLALSRLRRDDFSPRPMFLDLRVGSLANKSNTRHGPLYSLQTG